MDYFEELRQYLLSKYKVGDILTLDELMDENKVGYIFSEAMDELTIYSTLLKAIDEVFELDKILFKVKDKQILTAKEQVYFTQYAELYMEHHINECFETLFLLEHDESELNRKHYSTKFQLQIEDAFNYARYAFKNLHGQEVKIGYIIKKVKLNSKNEMKN